MGEWGGDAITLAQVDTRLISESKRGMYCRRLELKDFRNLGSVELSFGPGVVLAVGANAQGKSNLLESILTLSTGRGRSTRPLADLIYSSAGERRPFARVRSDVSGQNGYTRLELVFSALDTDGVADRSRRGRTARRATVDGKPTPLSRFIGRLKAVYFSPEDVDLLIGPPSLRRRFLDISASQADEMYLRNLMDYNHVVTQRNALLREIRMTGGGASRSLEFWDMKLSELAAPIVESRRQFVSHLSLCAAEFFWRLWDGGEPLEFSYAIEAAASLENASMLEALEALREREIRAGQSLLGPHRDDLTITLGGQSVAGYGSRGQHRLAVLSLKFAQLQWLRDAAGELPILLLDDIFSELDSHHRATVASQIPEKAQVFVSSADIASVPRWLADSARLLRVNGGSVEWKQVDAAP